MGCGQSAWEDDQIAEQNEEMAKLFDIRASEFTHRELEAAFASLYGHLSKQQLTRQTWGVLDNMRKLITKGTPDDCGIYRKQGHWYQKV